MAKMKTDLYTRIWEDTTMEWHDKFVLLCIITNPYAKETYTLNMPYLEELSGIASTSLRKIIDRLAQHGYIKLNGAKVTICDFPKSEKQAEHSCFINDRKDVRDNKNLNALQKLIYDEIVRSCRENEYCCNTNSYFASVFGVSNKTVSVAISALKKEGYITTELSLSGHVGVPNLRMIKLV